MSENIVNNVKDAIGTLKNNRTGSLKLKNGRLAIDTGTDTHYTEIIGDNQAENENEAIAGDNQHGVNKAKNATDHTGDLYAENGNLYAEGYGQITLVR